MPSDELRVLAELAGRWGLDLRTAQRVRKVWRLETDKGSCCLKRTILTPRDLLFVHEVLDYLQTRGFQSVLPCLRALTGETYTVLNSQTYVLYPWRQSREADFGREADLALGIKTLTELHKYSTGFIPYRSDPDRVRWGLWPRIFSARRSQLAEFGHRAAAKARSSTFCAWYAEMFPYYYAQSWQALSLLAVSPYAELSAVGVWQRTICHHDCSARNLLIDENERVTLVDFDYCLADLRLHDLGNLMLRLLRHNHWRTEIAVKVLSLYGQYEPLDAREQSVLYPFLLWPQDFWQVGLQYFLEELPWSQERFAETLRRKIEERAERAEFLAWYREEYWRP